MGDFKYSIVFVVLSVFAKMTCSQLNVPNLQGPPGYNYPNAYPHQNPYQAMPPMYQPPMPYFLPFYAGQPLPISPIYPPNVQQAYPYNLYNPAYGPFNPPYQPYPYYPAYSQQPGSQFNDPYAHIPTEIIDIDTNSKIDPGFIIDDDAPIVDVNVSQQPTKSETINRTLEPIRTSNVVNTKPFQTTITRTFDSSSSDPVVNVQYSNSNLQPSSGVLIDANGVKEEKGEINENDEHASTKDEDEEEDGFLSVFG